MRFSYNQVGNSVVCLDDNDGFPSADVREPTGTALKIIGSTANLTDVSFEYNAPYFTNYCGQGRRYFAPMSNWFVTGTVFAKDSNVSIQRSRFLNNEADYGSAIAFRGNGKRQQDGTFENKLTMQEVEIKNNFPTLIHSTVPTNNSSSIIGENARYIRTAVDIAGAGSTLRFVNISKNSSAGISAMGSDVVVKQSALQGNALHAVINQKSLMTVENVLIDGNLQRPGVFGYIAPSGNYGVGIRPLLLDNFPQLVPGENVVSTLGLSGAITKTHLTHVTLSNKFIGDHFLFSAGPNTEVTVRGSILDNTKNVTPSCNLTQSTPASFGANLDSNSTLSYNTCHLNEGFGLYPGLADVSYQQQVGPTHFLSMPISKPTANSHALQREVICSVQADQVGNPRPWGSCDSGAIEIK